MKETLQMYFSILALCLMLVLGMYNVMKKAERMVPWNSPKTVQHVK